MKSASHVSSCPERERPPRISAVCWRRAGKRSGHQPCLILQSRPRNRQGQGHPGDQPRPFSGLFYVVASRSAQITTCRGPMASRPGCQAKCEPPSTCWVDGGLQNTLYQLLRRDTDPSVGSPPECSGGGCSLGTSPRPRDHAATRHPLDCAPCGVVMAELVPGVTSSSRP